MLPKLLALGLFFCSPAARAADASPTSGALPERTRAPVVRPALSAAERQGVVLVEHAGRVIALGTVLQADGRILTAFSRVARASQGQLFVRYADGKRWLARIGHSDPGRDLALLVPKVLHSRHGIRASLGEPAAGAALSSFSVGVNRTLARAGLTLKGNRQAPLSRVLEIVPSPNPVDWGGPLLDVQGQAVAVTVSGCFVPPAPAEAGSSGGSPDTLSNCTASPVGMPVSEVRAFLRGLPASAEPDRAWLGIDGVSADTGRVRGIRIGSIEPRSPAASLGLLASSATVPGDLLVGVAGRPVPTPDVLQTELETLAPGTRVELLIYGKDGYRVVPVRLAERPVTLDR